MLYAIFLYLLKASLESLDDCRGEAFMFHLVESFYSDSSCSGDLVDLHFRIVSGSVMPSTSDIKMTNNLKKACSLLEVNLIDHLIISKEECYSFADEASFKIKK